MNKALLMVCMLLLPSAHAQVGARSVNYCSKTETKILLVSTEITDAAKNGDAKRIAAELRRGLDPNSTTYEGFSLLHLAITEHKDEVFDLLVKSGADLNQGFMGSSPLALAGQSNNAYAQKVLLGKGARPSDFDDALTAVGKYRVSLPNGVMESIKQGDMRRLSLYVRTMVDINEPLIKKGEIAGFTAMHVAAAENSVEAIRYLAGCGANVNARVTSSGAPVLWFAKKPEVRELLKTLGAIDEAK